jgi:Tol biopolymer transport system component
VGTENSYSPAVSQRGDKLAYTHGTGMWTIARTELAQRSKPLSRQLLTSNEQDSAPRISPDGTRIAFQSWRTGAQEIWICAADGSNPAQLTNFNGPLSGSPRWSPDGQRIAFDSRVGGYSHIYVVDANGGMPRAVTSGNFNDIVPSWSADGKSLLFSSNRSGADQIWRIPASGAGTARQITSESGMFSSESPDGLWIYHTKQNVPGLWRIPADGGQEQKVLDDPPNDYQGYWTLTRTGIFYLHRGQTGNFIEFASFADSRKPTQVFRLELQPTPLAGVSVSPDGHWLVSAQMPAAGSNISLVENFR